MADDDQVEGQTASEPAVNSIAPVEAAQLASAGRSSSTRAAPTPSTADATPAPLASTSAVPAGPKRKTRAGIKVSSDQGRLAFGKPGEGWKIEKAPEPPAGVDAPPPSSDQGPALDDGSSGPAAAAKKAPVKGKGKGKAASSSAGAATKPRPPVKGARKGKAAGTDPEAAEMQGMQSKVKPLVKAAPKKRGTASNVSKGAQDSEPEGEHPSSDVVFFEDAAGPSGSRTTTAAGGLSSDPIVLEPVAGPSRPKPLKKNDLNAAVRALTSTKPPPKGKAAARPKRKSVTVLSSGSETETGGSTRSRTAGPSTAASIIITEDEVEAASDTSGRIRSPIASAGPVKAAKALHPFFGVKGAAPLAERPKLSRSIGGSSAEFAIDVEAAPDPPPPPPTRAMPSFFSSRLGSKPTKLKPVAALLPRWPTREETLVGLYSDASSDLRRIASLSDVRRSKLREDASVGASAFWADLMPRESASAASTTGRVAGRPPPAVALPGHLAEHPAFARLAALASTHTPDLWADRFRPLAAAEVLGNEDEAVYLRDWLVALQVKVAKLDGKGAKSAAKRQVLRKVDKSARKRRKKATEDDWIVVDDELEYFGDPVESDDGRSSDEDTLENLKQAPVPVTALLLSPSKLTQHYTSQTRPQLSTAAEGSKTAAYPPLAISSLSNSILLVGPSGAGKTAAVYACAHELGWDVFEVYPGVRRSGVALGEMVGEVGKNHLVGRGGTGGGSAAAAPASAGKSTSTNALTSLLKKAPRDDGFGLPKERDPRTATSSPFGAAPVNGQQIRQSCILLEEVDILFQEDKGFWPAVVSLISESRRPVIMTCNDISAVPLDDLPLQATLIFLPPPAEVATPYLQRLAHAGGLDLAADTITAFHRDQRHHAFTAGVPHLTGHPAPSQPPDSTDLRRTINNLQTLRGTAPDEALILPPVEDNSSETRWDGWAARLADWATPSVQPPADRPVNHRDEMQQLAAIALHLDSVSFADAHIDWRAADLSEIFDPDRFATSENDPVDYDHLLKPLPDPLGVDLPEHGLSRLIASANLALSRSRFDRAADLLGIPQPTPSSDLLEWIPRRRVHLAKLLDMLEPLIEAPAPLLPSPALILDYVPIIQAMVQIDDVLEAEDKAQAALGLGRGKQGRVMRASAQAGMAALAKWTGGAGGRVAYERQLYRLHGDELVAARATRLSLDA